MSTNIKTSHEIVVTAPDAPGVLSKISTTITNAGVNIHAICGYEIDGKAHLRLITDNMETAKTALFSAGFEPICNEVVISEVSPHVLHPEIATLAGNYDVENNYWCASAHNGEHAVLIFSPKDNIKGAAIL